MSERSWGFMEKIASNLIQTTSKRYLKLHATNKSLPPAQDEMPRLLYIHIPFCLTLCPYCSFHKFRFDKLSALNYFELLRKEMNIVHSLGYKFDSIYFGGGTTTILPQELAKTIDLAKLLFDIKEISCESDPAHLIDLENEYLKGKIDRLSIGIQTFNDRYLKQIGRFKKFGCAQEQYNKVLRAIPNFSIINVDMIYNYPNQSEEDLHKEIDTIEKLRPAQVTFYPLMYAPGIKEKLTNKWGELSDNKEAKFYSIIMQRMQKTYTQRSSWAWSLKDEDIIDEYVIERSEYVGIGSGAFSFLDNTLYVNTFSLPEYKTLLSKEHLPITHIATFPKRAIKQYRMMVELFGLKPSSTSHLFIENSLLKLFGVYKNGKITPKGRYLFSIMMREFYNGMDYVRETMRSKLNNKDGLIQ